MQKVKAFLEHKFPPVFYLLKWTLIALPLAFCAGSLVALFLWLLDKVTLLRQQQDWLLYLLPLAGVLIWWLYRVAGKNAEAGNNLILEEIHEPGKGVPLRMAPLVLISTVMTHLFGGSAGREGTAVQIGGSIAAKLGQWLRLRPEDKRTLLLTGIAAGFGAVFGTPLAATVFALEVVYIGRMDYKALLPCLIAGVLGDKVCLLWGIEHTQYHIAFKEIASGMSILSSFDLLLLLKVIAAGICFGLVSRLFSGLSHSVKNLSRRFIPVPWLIPVTGGILIIILSLVLGRDYLGLGVHSIDPHAVTIVSCFQEGGAGYFSWFWKILFTVLTISMGFKGGEVTPLFFIGAALGNTLGVWGNAPVDLMAGLGFIAVFAGAANTPLACTLMGIELFGGEYTLYYAVACFTAYYCSGHTGIYTAQRIRKKSGDAGGPGAEKTLETIREERLHHRKKFLRKANR